MPDGSWNGSTYYGRPQLKAAPFNNRLVGSYVFLAGLSGAAQLLSLLLDATQGSAAAATVRRGRWLAMLAPTVGSVCLICDLRTPRRFYNMLRVFKTTSPMSLGSWALVGFGTASTITTMLQHLPHRDDASGWLRGLVRVAQLPAGALGAVLCTYTAALFSATSTPRWAAAPASLAVRFGSASVASAAAALRLAEPRRSRVARDLDGIAVAALAAELAATLAGEATQQRLGLGEAGSGGHALAVAAPLALFTLSLLRPRRRSRLLSSIASLGVLAGSLAMRLDVMRRGDASAASPEQSLRFAQPR